MSKIERVLFQYIDDRKDPIPIEDGVVYVSEKDKKAVHNCACGCGKKVYTPIGGEYSWRIIREDDGTSTMWPSINNEKLPCNSHYRIDHNKVIF